MGELIPFARPVKRVARKAARAVTGGPRVTIRKVKVHRSASYPGGNAYQVSSAGGGIFGTKVRVRTKAQAERVRANIKAGRDATAGIWRKR